MLSTPPDQWWQRAEADRKGRTDLWFNGQQYKFDELVEARAGEHLQKQITPEKMQKRHAACQAGIAALAETFERVSPDVAVIIGDDQEEAFLDDNMPAFCVYWGDTMDNVPMSKEAEAKLPPGLAVANWGHHPPETATYPGQPELALHMIHNFMEDGFDVAHSKRIPAGRHGSHSIPHAYGFIHRRIMKDEVVPNVPVFINTFYPPNQPTLRRCYDFGASLGNAIKSWDSDKTVAVIASGGLTHFVVEEDLDQEVLAAMKAKDVEKLTHLPENRFNAGTSEIRNWIALAAAMVGTGLEMEVLDYVPCYRSEAGTGNAMCFAQWV
jgi:3-O-methylgallate 3,4-dioxygenase